MCHRKKYTHKTSFSSTIACDIGHSPENMIITILIHQPCKEQRDFTVKLVTHCIETYFNAEERFQKRYL